MTGGEENESVTPGDEQELLARRVENQRVTSREQQRQSKMGPIRTRHAVKLLAVKGEIEAQGCGSTARKLKELAENNVLLRLLPRIRKNGKPTAPAEPLEDIDELKRILTVVIAETGEPGDQWSVLVAALSMTQPGHPIRKTRAF